jgi:hypothetical protein
MYRIGSWTVEKVKFNFVGVNQPRLSENVKHLKILFLYILHNFIQQNFSRNKEKFKF